MTNFYSRREFLKDTFKTASIITLGAWGINASIPTDKIFSEPKEPDLYVLESTDYKKLIRTAFESIGGINKFVKTGSYVVIKPNASWSRAPLEAVNTHPDLVSETVRLCLKAGASKVDAIDNTCDNYKSAFKINGIENAVRSTGGSMIPLNESLSFTTVNIPNAIVLKKAEISSHVLKADCFINMPIAKDHSASTLSMSMKNYMGIVKDRASFHVNGLHQCIADISSFIKPNLIIMDCTRILLTNGPKGPGNVKVLNKIIIGTDHVAVDSLGAGFFGFKPHDIEYIKIARDMGIGRSDIENLNVLQKTY